MADPLSITTGVLGLIGVVLKVSVKAIGMVDKTTGAHDAARDALRNLRRALQNLNKGTSNMQMTLSILISDPKDKAVKELLALSGGESAVRELCESLESTRRLLAERAGQAQFETTGLEPLPQNKRSLAFVQAVLKHNFSPSNIEDAVLALKDFQFEVESCQQTTELAFQQVWRVYEIVKSRTLQRRFSVSSISTISTMIPESSTEPHVTTNFRKEVIDWLTRQDVASKSNSGACNPTAPTKERAQPSTSAEEYTSTSASQPRSASLGQEMPRTARIPDIFILPRARQDEAPAMSFPPYNFQQEQRNRAVGEPGLTNPGFYDSTMPSKLVQTHEADYSQQQLPIMASIAGVRDIGHNGLTYQVSSGSRLAMTEDTPMPSAFGAFLGGGPQFGGASLQQSVAQHNENQRRCIPWALSNQERKQYDQIFHAWDLAASGFLDGKTALDVFGASGLDKNDLARIWALADRSHRGKLNREEFHIAMSIIYRVLNGNTLPSVLPAELVPPSEKNLNKSVNMLQAILADESYSHPTNGGELSKSRCKEDPRSDRVVYRRPDEKDITFTEQLTRADEDEGLDGSLNALKLRIKRIQEDIDYTSRGPRSFSKDEERRKLERELLFLLHEVAPNLHRKIEEREQRRKQEMDEQTIERNRRNYASGGYGGRNDDYGREDYGRHERDRTPPPPALKDMTREQRKLFIRAEAQRRLQVRMAKLGLVAPGAVVEEKGDSSPSGDW